MPPRRQTSSEDRARAIGMLQAGETMDVVGQRFGVTRQTVASWLHRYQDENTPARKVRDGVRQTSPEEDQRLINAVQAQPLMPLKLNMAQAAFPLGADTARARLREADEPLKARVAAETELLNAGHIAGRLAFAQQHVNKDADFWNKVIFSDEKVFQSTKDGSIICYRPDNHRYDPRYTYKKKRSGRVSVSVYGYISAYGRGELVRVNRRMDRYQYVEILEEVMIPTVRVYYFPEGERFTYQHDNSSIHTSNHAQQFLREQRDYMDVLQWAAKSPDLNPVENCWAETQRLLRAEDPLVVFNTADTLWTAVQQAWEQITPQYCSALYNSMPQRMRDVVANRGEWTRY